MSDERIPAWAVALEDRLGSRFDNIGIRFDALELRLDAVETRLNGVETRNEADVRDHHLLTEVTKAINDCEARLTRRLDDIRDDIGVNMARADLAHTKIDADRLEVASLRKELAGLYRRLQDVEHRLFKGDPKSPGAAP
jgi:chromosome segregation ATPase